MTLLTTMIGAVIVALFIIMFLFDYREYVSRRAPHEIQYGTKEFDELDLIPSREYGWDHVWKGKLGYYCFDADGLTVYGPFFDPTTASIEGKKYFS